MKPAILWIVLSAGVGWGQCPPGTLPGNEFGVYAHGEKTPITQCWSDLDGKPQPAPLKSGQKPKCPASNIGLFYYDELHQQAYSCTSTGWMKICGSGSDEAHCIPVMDSKGKMLEPAPLKCGKYEHEQKTAAHCANTCPPDGTFCTTECMYVEATDVCAPDLHTVTEKEFVMIMERLKKLEAFHEDYEDRLRIIRKMQEAK